MSQSTIRDGAPVRPETDGGRSGPSGTAPAAPGPRQRDSSAVAIKGFEAIKTITIDASRAQVWDALTDPRKIAKWLHGTTVSTDWFVGSPITWSGEWKGKSYADKGVVLEFDPENRLRTTHWSPLGGTEDTPENYHTVTYDLAGHDGRTTLTLTQDNNASRAEAEEMADANWGPVLLALKKEAESNG